MRSLLVFIFVLMFSYIFSQNQFLGFTNKLIVSLDTSSAKATVYSSEEFDVFTAVRSLTYVPSQGKYYGVDSKSGVSQFFSYSDCEGLILIGEIRYNNLMVDHSEALAFDEASGNMYISYGLTDVIYYSSNRLGIINLKTAEISQVGIIDFTVENDIDAMTCIDGHLYVADAGNVSKSWFYEVDKSNAKAKYIGEIPYPNLNNLAYEMTSGNLYGYSAKYSQLLQINTSNASVRLVGTTHLKSEFDGEIIGGFSFGEPSKKLKGSLLGLVDSSVVSINPETAELEVLKSNLSFSDYQGLAFHNVDKALYFTEVDDNYTLKKIDSCFNVTIIGDLHFDLNNILNSPVGPAEALAYNSDNGKMYIAVGGKSSLQYQSEYLGEINTETAEITILANINGNLNNEADDFEFGNDEFYLLDGTGSLTTRFYSLNPSNGLVDFIGDTKQLNLTSLAYDSENEIMYTYSLDERKLFSIATTSGKLNYIGATHSAGQFHGLRIKEIASTNSGGMDFNSIVTGLDNKNEGNNFFYPNPSQKHITLLQEVKKLSIQDLTGRVRLQSIYPSQTVDVSDLENGSYILVLETDKGLISEKLIIFK